MKYRHTSIVVKRRRRNIDIHSASSGYVQSGISIVWIFACRVYLSFVDAWQALKSNSNNRVNKNGDDKHQIFRVIKTFVKSTQLDNDDVVIGCRMLVLLFDLGLNVVTTIGWKLHLVVPNWLLINWTVFSGCIITTWDKSAVPVNHSINSTFIITDTDTLIFFLFDSTLFSTACIYSPKKRAPPWKSDSSYAMRCAKGHVKIQSELSSRFECRLLKYFNLRLCMIQDIPSTYRNEHEHLLLWHENISWWLVDTLVVSTVTDQR